MDRHLALIGTLISTISMILIIIYGILPLLIGKIDPTEYLHRDELRKDINIISVAQSMARIGIIMIFYSTIFNTNILMMIGSIGGIWCFILVGINGIYELDRFLPSNILSFMFVSTQFISVISVILFAIGCILFYKRSKLLAIDGAIILIYILFYIFLYSTIINLIYGAAGSMGNTIFGLVFFSFENIIFAFVGWPISFSTPSESNKRIDLMETVFNLDSSFVN